MILAFSSSSPICSVALLDDDGRLLAEMSDEAQRNASACMIGLMDLLLSANGTELNSINGFVADVGPGSFTGTRVAVMMAKTLAYGLGVQVAGASSLELIGAPCAIANRKGEWFVLRDASAAPELVHELPAEIKGYGAGIEHAIYPRASSFATCWSKLTWVDPFEFLPQPLVAPSISTPKKPLMGSHG